MGMMNTFTDKFSSGFTDFLRAASFKLRTPPESEPPSPPPATVVHHPHVPRTRAQDVFSPPSPANQHALEELSRDEDYSDNLHTSRLVGVPDHATSSGMHKSGSIQKVVSNLKKSASVFLAPITLRRTTSKDSSYREFSNDPDSEMEVVVERHGDDDQKDKEKNTDEDGDNNNNNL